MACVYDVLVFRVSVANRKPVRRSRDGVTKAKGKVIQVMLMIVCWCVYANECGGCVAS